MKKTNGNTSTNTPSHTGRDNSRRARSPWQSRLGMQASARVWSVAGIIAVISAVLAAQLPDALARTSGVQSGVSVAVLPFEVFSIEKEPTLGAEVAAAVAKQLALNPAIACVDGQKVHNVLQPDDYVSMNEDRLRQISKILNANCIITGTVTKIRAEHSIDVEMFTSASAGPHFKTFAEGLEIPSLVETIATALDQEIMIKADRIPAAERPQTSAGRQSTKDTPPGGYDVERELLAAFGPQQEKPAADTAPSAHALEAEKAPEPVIEAMETAPGPAPAPSDPPETAQTDASASGTPAAEKPDTSQSKKKRLSSKNAEDPGFFSLSKAISINSDTMEYDNRSNMAIFNGNVVARQDDIAMFANSMHVFYSQNGGLSRVEAKGDVRVVQGDRIATGSSIVFDNDSQTIVATGNPRVWQGDNVVHGRKITVYLKEERTVVESEPNSRASATIYPDNDKKRP